MAYPKVIEQAMAALVKLPGVGPRSAERMVFWILNTPTEQVQALSESLVKVKEDLRFCRICNNLSETELCMVCSNPVRDSEMICVVEDPKHVMAIEKSGSFKGVYHVLLGTICPSEGRGPENIKIQQLIHRLQRDPVKEVVLATDPDTDGEMTALYLIKELAPLNVKVTRIGVGLPMGGSVEYADISSLSMSLISRRDVTESV